MGDEEKDYHNFSTSPVHKLPTLNGTQAFRLAVKQSKPHLTGILPFDDLLCGSEPDNGGGIRRGIVTEVYGPPGVGKTTFALQLAVNAMFQLEEEAHVTWIDTASTLVLERLKRLAGCHPKASTSQVYSSTPKEPSSETVGLRQRFHHVQINRLPQLLALVLHPSPDFPPKGTSLIVLDDISNFLLSELSSSVKRTSSLQSSVTAKIRDDHAAKLAASRRANIIASFASGIQKLAATTNTAVLLICKASSMSRNGQKAVLRPALNSQQWVSQISTRILLYRDMWPNRDHDKLDDDKAERRARLRKFPLRFAELERLEGKEVCSEGIPFIISQNGLQAVSEPDKNPHHLLVKHEDIAFGPNTDEGDITVLPSGNDNQDPLYQHAEDVVRSHSPNITEYPSDSGARVSKRKAFEIADSEDEGAADDEEIPLPPIPQRFSGFLPSSQLTHEVEPHTMSGGQSKDKTKTKHTSLDAAAEKRNDENEDMLFDAYEAG